MRPGGFLTARLALCGGKGGFGSTLRAMGKAGNTENTSDCRDLNGRRMRDVEAQQSAEEWAAGQKDRDDAKVAAKKEREEQKVAAREAEEKVRQFWKLCHSCQSPQHICLAPLQAHPLLCACLQRWGRTCSCMWLWQHRSATTRRMQVIQDEVVKTARMDPERVGSSVAVGLQRASAQPEKRSGSAPTAAAPRKRAKVFGVDSDEDDEDLSSSESDAEGRAGPSASAGKKALHAHAPAADSRATDAGGSKADAALAVVGTDEVQQSSEDDVTAALAG